MQLVEKYIINKNDERFKELDELCFNSKHIYNQLLYFWRQELIHNEKFLSQKELYKLLKNSECYKYLPQNVVGQVFIQVTKAISSYFAATKAFKKNPENFTGKPSLPKYKDPKSGRTIAVFTERVLPKKQSRIDGYIRLSGLKCKIKTEIPIDDIKQVRVIPRGDYYKVEAVYNFTEPELIESDCYAAIDMGVNNLATVGFNDGQDPFIITGKPLKSINQFFNKTKAELQSKLETINKIEKGKTSKRIRKLQNKRNNKVNDYLHKSSKILVNQLVSKNCSILVIGKNKGWKQEINIGKKNNQNFVQIPFSRFIDILKYKCAIKGIRVIIQEESYTSKCSFLDKEDVKKHEFYQGKRIKRGLFRSSTGKLINADLNGSYNILKKAILNNDLKPFDRIEDVLVHPKLIKFKY